MIRFALALCLFGIATAAWAGINNSAPGTFRPKDIVFLTDQSNGNNLTDDAGSNLLISQ